MSHKFKERVQMVGIVLGIAAFVLFLIWGINTTESNRQSQMEWDVACQELGGRIFSNAGDKCVVVNQDGALGVVLTRQQFETNLKNL